MRTTIELEDNLKEKLATEAARRKEKGFSRIIDEALREYFARREEDQLNEINHKLDTLWGSLSEKEVQSEKARLATIKDSWRIK